MFKNYEFVIANYFSRKMQLGSFWLALSVPWFPFIFLWKSFNKFTSNQINVLHWKKFVFFLHTIQNKKKKQMEQKQSRTKRGKYQWEEKSNPEKFTGARWNSKDSLNSTSNQVLG